MNYYHNMTLVCDNILVVIERCHCLSFGSSNWCGECIDGERPGGSVDLNPLLSNLAIAGALTRSYRLGDNHGWESAADQCSCGGCGYDEDEDERHHVKPGRWWPNAGGKAAP